MKCVRRGEIKKNAELAGQTCTLLGFSGYSSHQVQMVNENGEVRTRRPPTNRHVGPFSIHSWDRFKRNALTHSNLLTENHVSIDQLAELVGVPQNCFALSIECVPHMIIPSNSVVEPIIDIDQTTKLPEVITSTTMPMTSSSTSVFGVSVVDVEIETTSTTETIKPDKPEKPEIVAPVAPIRPIEPVIQPDKKPNVVVPFEPDNHTDIQYITNNFHVPWTATIYIDGNPACIGIVLGELWILAERSCINSTRYLTLYFKTH